MHFVFLLFRFYPYWAIPISILLIDVAVYFRRRASIAQWYCFGIAGFLLVFTIAWIAMRGDLYSDNWVKVLLMQR